LSGAYLDSCILIYLLEGRDAQQESVRSAVEHRGIEALVKSDLVSMECLAVPMRNADSSLETQYRATLATFQSAILTTAVFERAARLRAEHRLKTPDAIHLAAAIEHECDEFWTNDRRLAEAAADSLTIRVLP
jgi:uncharacterized protein